MSKAALPQGAVYDHVFIIGPDTDAHYVQSIRDACENMGARYILFGNGHDAVVQDEILCRELTGRTHSDTRIHYCGHGNLWKRGDERDHMISLNIGVRMTSDVLDAHKEIPGIRHVWSCYAGAAKAAVKPLAQQGMPVVLHSNEEMTTLMSMSIQSIIDLTHFCHERQQRSQITTVYDDCAHHLATSPETLIVLTPGHESFRASSPKTHMPLQDVTPYIHYQHRELQRHYNLTPDTIPITPEQEAEHHYRTLLLRIHYGQAIDPVTIRPEEVSRVSIGEWSPLTSACADNNMQAVQTLLALGAEIGSHNKYRVGVVLNAIAMAEAQHNTDLVRALQDKVFHVLIDACEQGNHDQQSMILDTGIWDKNALFYWACETGHSAMAEVLCRHGVDVNVPDNASEDTPLIAACRKGHVAIVDMLLQKGAGPNARYPDTQETALHIVAAKESATSTQIIPLLLNGGADVNAHDNMQRTPLHYACDENIEPHILQLLNVPQVNITYKDVDGNLPIHLAMDFGSLAVMNALLAKEHDISLKHRNDKGYTPLHCAAQGGRVRIIPLLLQHGAEVNATQASTGCTALHLAAKAGHKDTVAALLEGQAGINIPDRKGRTPLWVACYKGNEEAASLLLERGAMSTLADENGRTPRQIASEKGYEEIVEELSKYEEKVLQTTKGKALARLEGERATQPSKGML